MNDPESDENCAAILIQFLGNCFEREKTIKNHAPFISNLKIIYDFNVRKSFKNNNLLDELVANHLDLERHHCQSKYCILDMQLQ